MGDGPKDALVDCKGFWDCHKVSTDETSCEFHDPKSAKFRTESKAPGTGAEVHIAGSVEPVSSHVVPNWEKRTFSTDNGYHYFIEAASDKTFVSSVPPLETVSYTICFTCRDLDYAASPDDEIKETRKETACRGGSDGWANTVSDHPDVLTNCTLVRMAGPCNAEKVSSLVSRIFYVVSKES